MGGGVLTPDYYAHIRAKTQRKIRFFHVFLENSFHLAEVLPTEDIDGVNDYVNDGDGWMLDTGHKLQAASYKPQAASRERRASSQKP